MLQARKHGGGAFPLCRAIVILDAAPGPLTGTTVQTFTGTLGHLAAWFPQDKCMSRLCGLGIILNFFGNIRGTIAGITGAC